MDILAFAEPSEVSLGYARPPTEYEDSKDSLVSAIRYYDSLIELYTKNPNSTFYTKSAREQQKFFRNIIDDVSDIITEPSAYTICKYAEIPYLYRWGNYSNSEGDSRGLERIETEGESIIITGIVQGVTVLDSLLGEDQPLRSIDELIDPSTGLCLIMKPLEGSMDPEQVDDRDLLIPVRLIDELDIVMH